jgi:hypothetical protein
MEHHTSKCPCLSNVILVFRVPVSTRLDEISKPADLVGYTGWKSEEWEA